MKPDFDANPPITVVVMAIAGTWLLAAGILIGLVIGEHVGDAEEQKRTIEDLKSNIEEAISKMPTLTPAENGDQCSTASDESANKATESNDTLDGIAQDVEAIRNLMPINCDSPTSTPKLQASPQVSFCPANCAPEPIGAVCFKHDSDIPLINPQSDCDSGSSDESFYSISILAHKLEKEIEYLGSCGLVLVKGHVNSIGSVSHNLDLSEDRAKAVISGLREELSGDNWRFRPISKGESHNEPNPERDSDSNRKASVALCVPAPATPSTETEEVSK